MLKGYAGITVMFRINQGDIIRDKFEFKTKSGSYLGISLKDEEEAKKVRTQIIVIFILKIKKIKFLYRLSEIERSFEYFRSNTIDFISFGFNKLKQGSHIGLPPSYFAKSISDLPKLTPINGFHHVLGQNILPDDFNQKFSPEIVQKFYESLLLSNDAKLFGLAREVAKTDNFMLSSLDLLIELICLSGAYMYSYAKTRAYKMQYLQRRRVYVLSGLLAFTIILASKLFISKALQNTIDFQACQMGLDCCMGSVEFYEKMIERNKILRDILINGHKLIDSSGNFIKQPVYLPLTDHYFYTKFVGSKLTDRKENCRKYLDEMIKDLDTKIENNDSKTEQFNQNLNSSQIKSNSKETKLFEIIKLKLESFFPKS